MGKKKMAQEKEEKSKKVERNGKIKEKIKTDVR